MNGLLRKLCVVLLAFGLSGVAGCDLLDRLQGVSNDGNSSDQIQDDVRDWLDWIDDQFGDD